MYQMLLKARNKKGFTLVEVIVVLVILAILAAILIPSMIGWIRKAEDKSAVVEARTMLLAAQTIASENYSDFSATVTALTAAQEGEAEDLADVGATFTTGTVDVNTDALVTGFEMTASSGQTVTYDSTETGAAKFTVS